KPSACTLPDDVALAFNVRAFSPDGDCATRSHRRRVRTSEKNAVPQAFTWCRFAPGLGNLTWSNWIIWLAPESFPTAIMYDERIGTVGRWQHAIGNVIAGPACCPRADPVVDRRRHCLFIGSKGGDMIFRHSVVVCAEPRAQGQPYKELISCLRPRVV